MTTLFTMSRFIPGIVKCFLSEYASGAFSDISTMQILKQILKNETYLMYHSRFTALCREAEKDTEKK